MEAIKAVGSNTLNNLMRKAQTFVTDAQLLLRAAGFEPSSVEIQAPTEKGVLGELVIMFPTRVQAEHCAHWFFERGYVRACVMPFAEGGVTPVHVEF